MIGPGRNAVPVLAEAPFSDIPDWVIALVFFAAALFFLLVGAVVIGGCRLAVLAGRGSRAALGGFVLIAAGEAIYVVAALVNGPRPSAIVAGLFLALQIGLFLWARNKSG